MEWKTARRTLTMDRPLVMGILNVTPDSFSDGGKFSSIETAIARAEQIIVEGVDIIDVGGESTRPGSDRVEIDVELSRVAPVIAQICKRHDIPVSIDTTRSAVATAAIDAGAEIINDISGLRWDLEIADVTARTQAALVLTHSRGAFENMHSQPPLTDVVSEASADLMRSIETAKHHGIANQQIAVDPGLGFGKSFEQNVELLAKLDQIASRFAAYPLVFGASRKSFVGKILGGAPADQRLGGSIATALLAVQKGANILRVHDVKETIAALKVLTALK